MKHSVVQFCHFICSLTADSMLLLRTGAKFLKLLRKIFGRLLFERKFFKEVLITSHGRYKHI